MVNKLKPEQITVHISWDEFAYVAQCEPYDVFTQGATIPEVLERLGKQFAVETFVAGSVDKIPLRDISKKTTAEILTDPATFETRTLSVDDGYHSFKPESGAPPLDLGGFCQECGLSLYDGDHMLRGKVDT